MATSRQLINYCLYLAFLVFGLEGCKSKLDYSKSTSTNCEQTLDCVVSESVAADVPEISDKNVEFFKDKTATDNFNGAIGIKSFPARLEIDWSLETESEIDGFLLLRRSNGPVLFTPKSGVVYASADSLPGEQLVVYSGLEKSALDTYIANGSKVHYSLYFFDAEKNYFQLATVSALTPIGLDSAKISRLHC